MKIGELAEALGTTVTALRYYEKRGLVHPPRTEGGTRTYGEEEAARFRALLALSAQEVPLDVIAELTTIRSHSASGDAASRAVEETLAGLEQELRERRRQLNALLADITKARKALPACHGCARPPRRSVCASCPDSSPLLRTQVMQLVWDEGQDEERGDE